MLSWQDNTEDVQDRHAFTVYKQIIALCIAERNAHNNLSKSFILCMPKHCVALLAVHFPTHRYAYHAPSMHNVDEAYYRWQPKI